MSVQISALRRLRLPTLLGAFLFLAFQTVVASLPEDAPIVVSEATSTRALVTRGRGANPPLTRVIPVGGQATVYVTNLDGIMKDEGRTAFRADIQDDHYYRYPLEIISLTRTRARPWVYALTFRLHAQLGDVGDALLRVTWRGMSSNRTRVSIGHEGGGIRDDEGSVPTPMPETPPVNTTAEVASLPWKGDRVRFIMQATFGVNAPLEFRIRRIGYSTWLEEQMEQKYGQGGDERFSTYPYPPFKTGPTIPPVDCNGTTGPNDPVDSDPLCFRNNYSMWPIQNWFFREALYGEDQQLRRRVSWALSQIFVVGGREIQQSGRMREYIKILDRNAFGNFREILREVTLSPAMGDYLDMARITRQNPNENYAREILQLFSVGVDRLNPDGTPQLDDQGRRIPTYTQATVDNFTKVFTGWTFCSAPQTCPSVEPGIPNYYDPMMVVAANHDNTQKVLFNGVIVPAGQEPGQDLAMAIDNIFHHPNVGPFISKLLIQQL